MTRWIHLFTCATLLSGLGGCFVTNPLQIPPPGSYTGLELIQSLSDRGFLNFYLGVFGYCEKFSNSKNCRRGASEEIINGALLSANLTPYAVKSVTPLEETGIYTGQSAEECLQKVGTGIFLTVNTVLTNNEIKDTAGNVSDEGIASAVRLAGPVAPYLGALNCRDILEEPGPILYFGRTDKLFDDDDDDDGENE